MAIRRNIRGRACPSEGAKVKANVGPDAGASNRATRAEMLPQRLGQEPIERNNPRAAPTVRITVIRVAPSDENPSQICSEFTSPRTTRWEGRRRRRGPVKGRPRRPCVISGPWVSRRRCGYRAMGRSKVTVRARRFGLAVLPARIQASEPNDLLLSVLVHHSCWVRAESGSAKPRRSSSCENVSTTMSA